MTRLSPRRLLGLTIVAGALSAGLGAAGLAGALPLGSHPASRHVAAGNPYFVCIAYQDQWGICVGPPTN